jgi:hypothetical protein
MSRRTRLADRIATVVAGLVVAAGGLVVLDLHYQVVGGSRLDAGGVSDVVGSGWWPWVSAAVAVLLGLVALAWLLGHLRRAPVASFRLAASDQSGRLGVDLGSVADAMADRLTEAAPVAEVSGSVRSRRGQHVVVLRAVLDPAAEVPAVIAAAAAAETELHRAFPDEQVACRLLVQAPRSTRSRRRDVVRVR